MLGEPIIRPKPPVSYFDGQTTFPIHVDGYGIDKRIVENGNGVVETLLKFNCAPLAPVRHTDGHMGEGDRHQLRPVQGEHC